ncbi:transposase-like protein [Pseudomonas nitritireducens]|uniref:Transposase-like protein n=1 Tax=Pseudomonas nitroreducens TaxID=46680 RepID=A0A7W7KT83_PSENT|nr:transposase [Pseudomonas nitritireducens]MBB4868291.1 transposase-like protein [Pseudomonas nitritireducens]
MSTASTEREIRQRRRYTSSFKAKIVSLCLQGDTSIAQVALQHSLNTNLVQSWIRNAKQQSQLLALPGFVAVPMQSPVAERPTPQPAREEVRIEILHRRMTLTVHWPTADAEGCARFMRELLQ